MSHIAFVNGSASTSTTSANTDFVPVLGGIAALPAPQIIYVTFTNPIPVAKLIKDAKTIPNLNARLAAYDGLRVSAIWAGTGGLPGAGSAAQGLLVAIEDAD